jgi:hypothetical protein
MKRGNLATVFAAAAMILAALPLIVALGGIASAGRGGKRIVVRHKTVPAATNQIEGNGAFDFVRAQQKCKSGEVPLSANAFFSQPAVNPVDGHYRADVNTIQRFREGRRGGYLAFGATDYSSANGNVNFTLQVVCQEK